MADWLQAWGAILARDVPMGGLQVAFFETFRCAMGSLHAASLAAEMPDSATDVAAGALAGASLLAAPDVATDICAGALAGALAAAFTTPLDVLVTHILTTAPVNEDGSRPSALCRARLLVEEQGALTLTRGLGLRTLYYAPLVGLFFGLYEYFRAVL